MKKLVIIIMLVLSAVVTPVPKAHAQIVILDVIKAAVKKVVKAIDLKIQRLQNKTIWLQNAQKTLENTMSKLKLDEIGDWVQKQKDLYQDYYEELAKVKSLIAYYQRIKDITSKQARLLQEYKKAWNLFQTDKHFSAEELAYMARVYAGILDQSAKNMEQITMVVNSFQTQMTDAKRLELINAAANKVDENYYDLLRFNQQNIHLVLQRGTEQHDVDAVRKMYGIQ